MDYQRFLRRPCSRVDALMSVLDDEEVDKLTGSAGRDLFYEGIGDDLTDVKNNEDVL